MSSPLGIPGLRQPDEIGRGGFGTVFRADEPEFGRAVAVKIIDDRLDDDEVRRAFVRECQAMGRLSGHPHIVTVHRGGTTELGEPYIVMDLMEAGSLAERLDRDGPLPWSEVLEIGVALAGALETAHRAGILHLDVKPANVLVSRYGEAKLADFGISRLPVVTATTDGRIRASIAYAAPERLLDGTATPSADLYALGSTLYTLLVGEPAFTTKPGEDLLVAIARVVRQPVPDLRRRDVPDPVAHVVERLLAKSPVDRFGTAADAAFALQAAQRATGQPVTRPVVEGAARGDALTWPVRPAGSSPDDDLPADQDPPLTWPRYVPPDRGAPAPGVPAADLVSWIPEPRGSDATVPAYRGYPADWPSAPPGEAPPEAAPTLAGMPGLPVDPAPPAPAAVPGPRSARRPLVVTAAVAVGVGLVAGAGVLISRSADVASPAGPPVPSSAAAPPPAPTSAVSTSAAPTSAAPTSAAPTSAAPTTGAPARQIAMSDGVAHPARDAVAARLDAYFRAINARDYDTAFEAFSPDSAVVRNGLAAFRTGNSTTEVLRQRILAIEDLDQGGVQATVTYRSTQHAEFGPNGETCTNWNLAYELTGPDLLIRRARAVTKPQAC